MTTMRWQEVGTVMVTVHARRPPDEAEWREYMDVCAKMGERLVSVLVLADVALTPKQRRTAADIVRAAGTKGVAVISTSMITRHITTAVGWLTGVHKGFHPSEIDSALTFLGVAPVERPAVLETARKFARELRVDDLAGIAQDLRA
jgi:hypothetical protein